jgi:MFS family permease
MQGVNILIGAVLLLFGRSLFWLFVGCVGFIAGFNFASQTLAQQPQWVILLIAIGVGLIAAIASIFLQRVVVGIAGFFAGGYIASTAVMALMSSNPSTVTTIAYVVGGIIGAILTMTLLDPALILLSSLAGATTICQNVPMDRSGREILFIVLVVIGIVVQSVHYSRTRKRLPPPSPPPARTG